MKTIALDMIEKLQHGLNLLGPASDKVIRYILSLQNADGGFRGRASSSDLYYTVFAVDILLASKVNLDRNALVCYLSLFEPQKLDFIHLCCWIRCAARIHMMEPQLKSCLVKSLNSYLCHDGLFHHVQAGQHGSVYGTFMAFSAAQDLGETITDPSKLLSGLKQFYNSDGSYKNEYGEGGGTLPPTAAAAVMQAQHGGLIEKNTVEWILSCVTDEGGFAVSPMMPVADLLSTATAVYALGQADFDTTQIREHCRSFIESLISNDNGFCANLFDPVADAEYTFYGLLAMGNLDD